MASTLSDRTRSALVLTAVLCGTLAAYLGFSSVVQCWPEFTAPRSSMPSSGQSIGLACTPVYLLGLLVIATPAIGSIILLRVYPPAAPVAT